MPLSTVALIFGGKSTEHEISIISAKSIAAVIDPFRFQVLPLYITHEGKWFTGEFAENILQLDLAEMLRSTSLDATGNTLRQMAMHTGQQGFDFDFFKAGIDLAFIALHGSYGEDGRIQGLLDTFGIPYTGCGVLASAVAMDKALTKLCVTEAGIATAPGITILSSEYFADPKSTQKSIEEQFTWPVFVKPASLGSSVGISKVHHIGELIAALETACRYDSKILVEKAMQGREVEVAVLGNNAPEVSITGEIEPGSEFYDYADKYIHNAAKMYIPARISPELQEQVRKDALRAYKALGCRGMSRIDFFVDGTSGTIVLNEVNTIPGFTDISMYPRLFAASGLPFNELVEKLLQFALETPSGARS